LAHRVIPRWDDASQKEAQLYKTHTSDRVLDYILMTGETYEDYVPGTAHVYGDQLTPPDSYNWREDPFPKHYASDHFPVIIDLRPADESTEAQANAANSE
jgi:hypothetical protein